jgi:hypothetical protein
VKHSVNAKLLFCAQGLWTLRRVFGWLLVVVLLLYQSSINGGAPFQSELTNGKARGSIWPPIVLTPERSIQDAVGANAPGSTFLLSPGVYRMQSVIPKEGDTFTGQPGAVLNGSCRLISFVHSGPYWLARAPVRPSASNGKCLPGYSGCGYPEDLFVDNVPLVRVPTLEAVSFGKWYFDSAAGRIYLADNPTDKTVEMSLTTHAFSGTAANVTIEGLVIEKYAVPAQDGAISCYGADNLCLAKGWLIYSNEIRLNHGSGIRIATKYVVRSNSIHHNGQEGLAGSGHDILIENNEIAFNNTLGFAFDWEAGGTKFAMVTSLVVRGNYVHDNKGPGLWLDHECYNWTIEGNRTHANYVAGILAETSYDGTVRYNVVDGDGLYPGKSNPTIWSACGIAVSSSKHVVISGNTVLNSSNGICAISSPRGSGNRGEFVVQNLTIDENVIVQEGGTATGAVASTASARYYEGVYTPSWNNHWTSNTYKLPRPTGLFYVWLDGAVYASMDARQWQRAGQDVAGRWISFSDSTFPSAKFKASQRVQTLNSTQVWYLPTAPSMLVATKPLGTFGTVTPVAGPIRNGGRWFWDVQYDDGSAGWTAEQDVVSVTPPPLP